MIDLGAAAPVPTKEQILAKYGRDLEKLISETVNQEVDSERSRQLLANQKADLYWRGKQWLVPNLDRDGSIGYSSLGTPLTGRNDDDGNSGQDYNQNIYRGDGMKFVAVLGQRMPTVKAVPDDPEDDDSLKVTPLADTSAAILHAQWGAPQRQVELAYNIWNFGNVYGYTPYVTNGQKYGYRTEPKISAAQTPMDSDALHCVQCGLDIPATDDSTPEQCPACDAPNSMQRQPAPSMEIPQDDGFEQYENGSVELYLCNSSTVTVPYFAKSLADATQLSYEYDEYDYRLKQQYPQLRKNKGADESGGGGDGTSTDIASNVRTAAALPSGVTSSQRTNKKKYGRHWLTLDVLQTLSDDAKVQELQKLFPDGLKVTMIDGKCYDIENERLTDVWKECKALPSQYINSDPAGADMMTVQDLRNDTTAIAYLTLEGGIPPTFANPTVIDVESYNKYKAVPNAVIPVLPSVGTDITQAFFRPEPAQFSNQLQEWMQWEHDTARTNAGIIPGIFGEGYGDQETAHTSEVRKNTAMQQLMVLWINICDFWQGVTANGVKQLAKYGSGQLTHVKQGDSGFEKSMVDIEDLTEGGWHFEATPSFPATYAEKRATLTWLLSLQGPVLDSLGITSVRNIAKAHDLFGMIGWYAPNTDEHYKAQEVIRELLKGQPIEAPPTPGQPPAPPQPSIPIDSFEDNHGTMMLEAQAWCISPIGRQTKTSNPAGYQNVVAWGMAHAKAAQPPAPPPPPLTTKMAISAKLSDLTPEERQKLDQDAHLAPGTPPIEGQLPSNPALPGSNMQGMPAPGMPPGGTLPAGPQ